MTLADRVGMLETRFDALQEEMGVIKSDLQRDMAGLHEKFDLVMKKLDALEHDREDEGNTSSSMDPTMNSDAPLKTQDQEMGDDINGWNCGYCGLKMLVSDGIAALLQAKRTNRAPYGGQQAQVAAFKPSEVATQPPAPPTMASPSFRLLTSADLQSKGKRFHGVHSVGGLLGEERIFGFNHFSIEEKIELEALARQPRRWENVEEPLRVVFEEETGGNFINWSKLMIWRGSILELAQLGEDKRWFLELAQFNFNPYRIKCNINSPLIRPNFHSLSALRHCFFNQFSPNLDPNPHDNYSQTIYQTYQTLFTIYQTAMATVRPPEMTVKKGPINYNFIPGRWVKKIGKPSNKPNWLWSFYG